jgi:hypothetical protein
MKYHSNKCRLLLTAWELSVQIRIQVPPLMIVLHNFKGHWTKDTGILADLKVV